MVKLLICGDFRAAKPEKIKLDNDIESLINGSHINICNFEAPIRVDSLSAIEKSGPSLTQSPDAPAFLLKAGFNVILLANNHIMDFGEEGCEATVKAFNKAIVVGAGKASDAYSVCVADVEGVKIGLLSVVQNEFGTIAGRDALGYGTAWVNSFDLCDIIKDAKHQCDCLLVFPHAGVEHTVAPLPEWRARYKQFVDWGADAVIASHPHAPQGWEDYHGKRIYYSLGDFYFDELTYDEWWYKSIAVELAFESGNNIHCKEHFVQFDKTGQISFDHSEKMKERMEFANELLNDEEKYTSYIDDLCNSHYDGLKYGILRGVCGVSLKTRFKYFLRLFACMLLGNTDEAYLLNTLQCESHRWVLERALNNRIKNKMH